MYFNSELMSYNYSSFVHNVRYRNRVSNKRLLHDPCVLVAIRQKYALYNFASPLIVFTHIDQTTIHRAMCLKNCN